MRASPVSRSSPIGVPLSRVSCARVTTTSIAVCPELVAKVFGTIKRASANALTPKLSRPRNDISTNDDPEIDLTFDGLGIIINFFGGGNFKSTGTWDDSAIINCIFNSSEAITNGILDL